MGDAAQIMITGVVVLAAALFAASMFSAGSVLGGWGEQDAPIFNQTTMYYNQMQNYSSLLSNATSQSTQGSLTSSDGVNFAVIGTSGFATLQLMFDSVRIMVSMVGAAFQSLAIFGIPLPFWAFGIAIMYISIRVGSALLGAVLKWFI